MKWKPNCSPQWRLLDFYQIVGGSEALQQHQKRKHKMGTLKHTGKAITKHKP
jgi:hypothetical protein